MAMHPMNKRKKKYEYYSFDSLAFIIHGYLQEDGLGLYLKGYKETMRDFFHLQDHDIDKIHELMIDCNLWFNYFCEIEALIQYKKEEWQLRMDWHRAHEVQAEPSEELESHIQHAKLRVTHYGMFMKQIHTQQRFFGRASFKCQDAYRKTFGRMARSV